MIKYERNCTRNGQNALYFPAKCYPSIHFLCKGIYIDCSHFKPLVSNFLASNLLFCCEELFLNLYWIKPYTSG